MDYHIDREIRLSEESEYQNLYSWFLQEFTRDGKSDGPKLIPWEWSFRFTANEVNYRKSIEINRATGDAPDQPDSESIHATLQPDASDQFPPRFSMFGTDRQIEKFSLAIRRLEDDQTPEQCLAWGIVSYTAEIDFQKETQDDALGIEISLTSTNFDDLRDLIRRGSADDLLQVRLRGVSGFYSDWSPSISTSSVKVLTPGKDQEVTKPGGCTIDPPRMGAVREFALSFTRRGILGHAKNSKPDEADEDVSAQATEQEERAIGTQHYDATLLSSLARAQEGIAKLRIPLWIIVLLLAAILIFK